MEVNNPVAFHKHRSKAHLLRSFAIKKISLLAIILFSFPYWATAQQKFNRSGMTYIIASKPNNIVYHDSIFRGSTEFKHLFFRTGNTQLMDLYDKHQSNKMVGQICSVIGAIGILTGVNQLSGSNKSAGWALIGGGFIAAAGGGYFTLASQRNLVMAVSLFNQQYNQSAATIGISKQSIGLVYKF